MNSLKSIYLFFVLAFSTTSAFAQHNSLLWEVTGGSAKDTSYLFGTFHALKGGFVDTMSAVTGRLARTDVVVGEMDMEPANMMSAQLKMLSETPLKSLLSGSDYKFADSAFKSLTGHGLGFFNMMKPMAAHAFAIKALFDKSFEDTSASEESMLDGYFQDKAKANGRPVVGLETMDEQIELLFGATSIEDQAEMLLETLRELDSGRAEMIQLTNCYIAGDLDCLHELGETSEGFSEEDMDRLVKTRNENWMKRLPDIMQHSRAFVAVGALHLTGEHGLIALLRKQGYTVTPVSNRGR